MENNANPLVSIIMPAFNAAAHIRDSIMSVLEQTYRNWELIVIDDGSTDDTARIVREYQKLDNRISYTYQQNKRLGAARNAGLRQSNGKYIAFLDSDDLWLSEKLELQVQAINRHAVDLVFSDGYMMIDGTTSLEDYPTVSGLFQGSAMFRLQFACNYIPVLSVLLRSEWVARTGFQGEDLEIFGCEDWDYWLRMARAGAVFLGMPEKLFKYRVHAGGMSRRIPIMKLAEFTALYNNIDYRYLGKDETYRRLWTLSVNNVPDLLKIGRTADARKELAKIMKLKFRLRNVIAYALILSNRTTLHRMVRYILQPRSLFVAIRKKSILTA